MKINKFFPVLKKGYTIDFIDCYGNFCLQKKVLATWYPNNHEEWSETKECEFLGYCVSSPKELFPQVLIKTHHRGGLYTMTGDDAERIINIYYKGNLIKRKLYYKTK